jgi:hypothetical protein
MSQDDISDWARTLQQSQLKGLVLAFIESAGPLKTILAQIMYSGAPFVSSSWQHKWQSRPKYWMMTKKVSN